jgi:hypothetical protein
MHPVWRSSQRTFARSRVWRLALAATIAATCTATAHVQDDKDKEKDKKDAKKPSLSLKVTPSIVFSPARISVTAELKGGLDDNPDLYCPSVEWDWGDGTRSESNADCEPFEAGKSTVQRRFTQTHTYDISGNYRVLLRLKRGSKVLLGGNVSLQVKPGLRDPNEPF